MAIAAGWALQSGLYQALVADATLISLLGGSYIHDDTPQRPQFPYVTISQSLLRDWSTGSEPGHEHVITLHIWSRARGKKQAHDIANALQARLHDGTLALTDHRLVNLRHEFTQIRRDPDGETYHGIVRFRAVTEVIV